jgi:hypothetical protein
MARTPAQQALLAKFDVAPLDAVETVVSTPNTGAPDVSKMTKAQMQAMLLQLQAQLADAQKPKVSAPRATKVRTQRVIKDVMEEFLIALAEDELDVELETRLVLHQVYTEFPGASSGPKDVAWYRNKLRNEGRLARREKLTAEERKANKLAYEKEYAAKQKVKKEAERQARITAFQATQAK